MFAMLPRMLIAAACVAVSALAVAGAGAGGCPPVVARADWGARPARDRTPLRPSAPYAVVHHSADRNGCTSRTQCVALVRGAQRWHMDNRNWSDIGYNFLVGEDGAVYEGRGWETQGAHAPGYNSKSIGICVLGDFTKRAPNEAALRAVQRLLECGASGGRLAANYKLLGHRQTKATSCPGDGLYAWVKRQPRWAASP